MKSFQEFQKIDRVDEGSKRGENSFSIWTSRKDEDTLRDVGYEIPKYPKQGDVTDTKGKKVGYISNFGGLATTDKTLAKIAKDAKMQVWNVL